MTFEEIMRELKRGALVQQQPRELGLEDARGGGPFDGTALAHPAPERADHAAAHQDPPVDDDDRNPAARGDLGEVRPDLQFHQRDQVRRGRVPAHGQHLQRGSDDQREADEQRPHGQQQLIRSARHDHRVPFAALAGRAGQRPCVILRWG